MMVSDNVIIARFRVNYPGFLINVDLELPGQGITVLAGPSGSGKTTVLRVIAGLECHTGNYLSVNGQIWQDDQQAFFVPTHQRSLAYVFQEASLFSHLSVKKNLEYGYKRSKKTIQRVDPSRIIEVLKISHLLERHPARLSGGERQRVAIGRALMSAPDMLLMDEPLAALALQQKQEILSYLELLQQTARTPLVYVTHSPEELMRSAHHVVLLNQGHVVYQGAAPTVSNQCADN